MLTERTELEKLRSQLADEVSNSRAKEQQSQASIDHFSHQLKVRAAETCLKSFCGS